jgi:hypothetical protein
MAVLEAELALQSISDAFLHITYAFAIEIDPGCHFALFGFHFSEIFGVGGIGDP